VTPRPLVSVVIPAYQAEAFLGEALASVRAQTYRPLDIVVVDDGSTDGTGEVISRFPEARGVRLAINSGLSAARNAGIAAARGELVGFLDADDLMLPERVAVQVQHLLDNPECGCVLGRQEVFVEPGVSAPPGVRVPDDPTTDGLVVAMSAMVRAAVLRDVGVFDPSLRLGEDMDWLFRLQAAGIRIDSLDQVLIRRRFHGGNLSYRSDEIRTALLRAVRSRLADGRRGLGESVAQPSTPGR
jgi:glycosyltransferase involved in cell wall biosynthesis